MVFDAINVLVAFLASRYGTSEGFLIRPIWRRRPTAISHNKFRAELLRRPRFIAILRFRHHNLILIHFAACILRKFSVSVGAKRKIIHKKGKCGERKKKRKIDKFSCYIVRPQLQMKSGRESTLVGGEENRTPVNCHPLPPRVTHPKVCFHFWICARPPRSQKKESQGGKASCVSQRKLGKI